MNHEEETIEENFLFLKFETVSGSQTGIPPNTVWIAEKLLRIQD
jgi:hypothetical protein